MVRLAITWCLRVRTFSACELISGDVTPAENLPLKASLRLTLTFNETSTTSCFRTCALILIHSMYQKHSLSAIWFTRPCAYVHNQLLLHPAVAPRSRDPRTSVESSSKFLSGPDAGTPLLCTLCMHLLALVIPTTIVGLNTAGRLPSPNLRSSRPLISAAFQTPCNFVHFAQRHE